MRKHRTSRAESHAIDKGTTPGHRHHETCPLRDAAIDLQDAHACRMDIPGRLSIGHKVIHIVLRFFLKIIHCGLVYGLSEAIHGLSGIRSLSGHVLLNAINVLFEAIDILVQVLFQVVQVAYEVHVEGRDKSQERGIEKSGSFLVKRTEEFCKAKQFSTELAFGDVRRFVWNHALSHVYGIPGRGDADGAHPQR
jgi:hypothetical protein